MFWARIRFYKLVYYIFDAVLEDPSKKQLIFDEFSQSSDHKISYFDFYTLLHEKIQINQVPEWVFSDFESYLDEQNEARVGIIPLVRLFQSYGFELGYDIKQDTGVEYAKKVQISNQLPPEQYNLTKADYYRGVTTILNSEKAALATCIKLFEKCQQSKNKWKDPDFGPTD